ncbi:unnamed protein product [Protopolystoma xenopodis]|uniref:Uncharacterized protein n=1 Tax=Protopolystoma xenopodis TaxID=117903 RepID=A0A448WF42_9PLAT|nr:unnamed protein product [Protopolystoma xenopodis]
MRASAYSLSPVCEKSQRLLQYPQKLLLISNEDFFFPFLHSLHFKPMRRIPRVPYKVLDAPELQDDFYLNLVDWSSQNMLAVGLGTCVYLWSAITSQVFTFLSLWLEKNSKGNLPLWGQYVAVGTYRGHVQIWDVHSRQCLRSLSGHLARVGALAWNSDLLASGSRDRFILLRDTRASHSTGGGPAAPLPRAPIGGTQQDVGGHSGNGRITSAEDISRLAGISPLPSRRVRFKLVLFTFLCHVSSTL